MSHARFNCMKVRTTRNPYICISKYWVCVCVFYYLVVSCKHQKLYHRTYKHKDTSLHNQFVTLVSVIAWCINKSPQNLGLKMMTFHYLSWLWVYWAPQVVVLLQVVSLGSPGVIWRLSGLPCPGVHSWGWSVLVHGQGLSWVVRLSPWFSFVQAPCVVAGFQEGT